MISIRTLIGLAIVVAFGGQVAGNVCGEEFRISPDTNLKDVAKQIQPGDAVVLENGTWTDQELKFEQLAGTQEKPIEIRAATPGEVVLTGESTLRISGEFITVSGLVFRDMQGASDVVEFRTHSERLAHHCRITECVFEETSDLESKGESRWLSIYGTNNRIDHCYFAGKKNKGTTLVVWVLEKLPQNHQIDHNHFGPRPELGKNGGETIRIGDSEVSESVSGTRVLENYFNKCNGEAELISNKSCENVYQHNFFDACSGTLTLRHGHRCLVDGNAFVGREERGTGGVRIIGQSHTVINNYFEGLRGDSERAALCMMNGIPNSPLNEYSPVERATVAHNTFIDCKYSMEIGVGAGKTQPTAPTNCKISHNIFNTGDRSSFRFHVEPEAFQWFDNKQQAKKVPNDQPIKFELVDLKFQRGADGLLRPTAASPIQAKTPSDVKQDIDGQPRQAIAVVGCDQPESTVEQWPDKSNTGPTWRRNEDRQ